MTRKQSGGLLNQKPSLSSWTSLPRVFQLYIKLTKERMTMVREPSLYFCEQEL
ncbi:hypothetical protein Hamer_G031849 [Homarus americanus]|uniref:Uncharacterized protein n=1 Tax=Homarus americanus TaxID=6706 RepID=A0A8J5K0Q0_HOMAM|nr:hypothetical protein Hamer_G031849 [Homarus americanus]